jgi:hypothetical protein
MGHPCGALIRAEAVEVEAILVVLLACQWTGKHYEGFCFAAMQPVFGNLGACAEKHGGFP